MPVAVNTIIAIIEIVEVNARIIERITITQLLLILCLFSISIQFFHEHTLQGIN